MNAPASRISIADRYQILGRLGTGGMAEVHLAKTVGPGGFEKLVVIKRMLAHLQGDPAHTAMFLDEARIVARIQHRNVVQVHDLHETDEGYLLVMEYLEGESASMYFQQMRPPDPWLAAFIICEAAQGLHAAHELRKPDGSSYNVVHRDVSPQNVFITYAGDVKLLDFGVARAEDRHTRTESGVVKGKFAYMAPEQFLDRSSIDRRSDIFALGTLLYELGTGSPLFDQGGVLEIIRAVCTQPIVPPSRVSPGFPPELDLICLKALQRDRNNRYATADEMARDLMRAMSAAEPSGLLRDRLSTTMMDRFRARRERKRALIERGEIIKSESAFESGGQSVEASTPPDEPDSHERSVLANPPTHLTTGTRSWLYSPVRNAVIAIAALALFSGAGLAMFGLGASLQSRSSAAGVIRRPADHIDGEPVASDSAGSSEAERAAESADESEPLAGESEPDQGADERVVEQVDLRVEAPGLHVAIRGGPDCDSPCVLRVDRSSSPVSLHAETETGRRATRSIVPNRNQTIPFEVPTGAQNSDPAPTPHNTRTSTATNRPARPRPARTSPAARRSAERSTSPTSNREEPETSPSGTPRSEPSSTRSLFQPFD